MNKAIEILMQEHHHIKKAIAGTQRLFVLVMEGKANLSEVKNRIDFFRKYADSYHHHKEEKVLFPEMIKRNEMLEFGVIHEMLENHEDFREMLAEIEHLVNEENAAEAQKKFDKYANALIEHIAVEDDEVFQIAETLMNEDELLTVLYLFEDCDRELGAPEKIVWESKV
ncbi:MAG: hemerythrin domain-containing protein [Bacteroidia bacterium]|nr:hemerythrin domain-containing protein [Bacteroidia bacterium]